MSVELVVFDMAGTTVKDKNYVGIAFQGALKSNGYTVDLSAINPLMGYKKPVAIRMILEKHLVDPSEITEELIATIHSEFVRLMIDFYKTTDEIAPLPTVEDTFANLRSNGFKIALNTGFSRDIAEVIVGRLGWEDTVDCLVASDDVAHGRPYPDMIQKIMQELNIDSAEKVAKVGDTEVDINEGFNTGCKYVIGVTTGAFTRGELEPYKPTHIVDSLAEVLEIVKN
jgi:phosphonatase-like hydrolase